MRGAVIDGYLSPNYIVRAHNSPQSLALVTGGISYGDHIPHSLQVESMSKVYSFRIGVPRYVPIGHSRSICSRNGSVLIYGQRNSVSIVGSLHLDQASAGYCL